jgi:hypothetical protein
MRDPKAVALFQEMLRKTEAGKMAWQPSGDPAIFVASMLGKYTLRLFEYTSQNSWGEPSGPPSVMVEDDKGNVIVEINSTVEEIEVDELNVLFRFAKRIALQTDDKLDELIAGLKRAQ